MFDIQKLKSNSYYIIPFIIQNVDLLYKDALNCVSIKRVGFNTYLELRYKYTDEKEISSIRSMLDTEKYLYTSYEDTICNDLFVVAKFLIPKPKDSLFRSVNKLGREFLSSSDLKHVYKYWKDTL